MSPASVLVAVAAVTATALVTVPAVSPDPPAGAAAQGVAAGQAAGVRAAGPAPAGPAPAVGTPAVRAPAVRAPIVQGPAVPAPAVPPTLGMTAARFRWPLSPTPVVLRRFAVGPQPWSPGHRGVDLAADVGQPVLAAGPGAVTFAGVVAGTGVVAVTHPGGIRTTYEPVTAAVEAGAAVAAGDALGVLASGAHCPASCLHWGALRGEVYLDPLTLLRPVAPPILLPMGGP